VISRRQFFLEAQSQGHLDGSCLHAINLHEEPYPFALSLFGAWLMGMRVLLPPDRSHQGLNELREVYPIKGLSVGREFDPLDQGLIMPAFDQEVLIAFTSGSTGHPNPHIKTFGMLFEGARLIDGFLGGTLGMTMVSTVPQQHMYGLELGVLLPLFCGAVLAPTKPFYPADITAALDQVQGPKALVSTPLHLKILLDSGLSVPPIDLIVSATAPLDKALAESLEASFHAPIYEIYGCTEAGSLAGRRPIDETPWRWFQGVRAHQLGSEVFVEADHLPNRVALEDDITVIDLQSFHLEGRRSDLINIAGKRNSLSGLETHYRAIKGVNDVALLIPGESSEGAVQRLVAFIIADDSLSNQAILEVLRGWLDPVFMPRRIYRVDRLPRNATGKIPLAALRALLDDQPKVLMDHAAF
jgi:acyl-coenzyme A synthetase/AMP-(fatty) acid ligase